MKLSKKGRSFPLRFLVVYAKNFNCHKYTENVLRKFIVESITMIELITLMHKDTRLPSQKPLLFLFYCKLQFLDYYMMIFGL